MHMNVYLSSTYKDLVAERQAVKDILGNRCVIKHSYRAASAPLAQSCRNDVANCHAYIGIVGLRYGSIPPGEMKSVTEIEFDEATRLGLPRLIFIKNDSATYGGDMVDGPNGTSADAIRRFRAHLLNGGAGVTRVDIFSTAEDLKTKVLDAYHAELSTLREQFSTQTDRVSLPSETPPAGSERVADLLTDSALRKMLRAYLSENRDHLFANAAFTKARLFSGMAIPLSVEAVMHRACDESEAMCETTLVRASGFFEERRASAQPDDIVCGAVARVLLVAAESYIKREARKASYQPARHEPVWAKDRLLSSVIAAERLGFGLCFKGGKRDPENVFEINPPQVELRLPGEEGEALMRSETLRAMKRLQPGSVGKIGETFLKISANELGSTLGANIVVSARASGAYAGADARAALQDYLEKYDVLSFFRDEDGSLPPPWAVPLLAELEMAFGPAFPATSTDPQEKKDMTNPASGEKSGGGITVNFNAPVAAPVAIGDGAQAAGRDVNNLAAPAWQDLSAALDALDRTIASHPGLVTATRDKARLLDDLQEVRDVIAKGKPEDGHVKLVKRCLEGIKQGAEALENGDTILEKLAPVWTGLKAAWPAFLALVA